MKKFIFIFLILSAQILFAQNGDIWEVFGKDSTDSVYVRWQVSLRIGDVVKTTDSAYCLMILRFNNDGLQSKRFKGMYVDEKGKNFIFIYLLSYNFLDSKSDKPDKSDETLLKFQRINDSTAIVFGLFDDEKLPAVMRKK